MFDKVTGIGGKPGAVSVFRRLFSGGHGAVDVRGQGHTGVNGQAGRQPQGFDDKPIVGVGQCDSQAGVIEAQGVGTVGAQKVGWQIVDFGCQSREVFCRHKGNAQQMGLGLGDIEFGHQPQIGQHRGQFATGFALCRNRPFQVSGRQFAEADQDVTQTQRRLFGGGGRSGGRCDGAHGLNKSVRASGWQW